MIISCKEDEWPIVSSVGSSLHLKQSPWQFQLNTNSYTSTIWIISFLKINGYWEFYVEMATLAYTLLLRRAGKCHILRGHYYGYL